MPAPSDAELIKHAVRESVWLPVCRRRLEAVRDEHGPEEELRYFAYSSGDALDPLFLYDSNIIDTKSSAGQQFGFTTVHIFTHTPDNPQPVIRALPGAQAFGGSFVDTVLFNPSLPSALDPDSEAGNRHEILRSSCARFKQFFPFDIINFDWDELLLDTSDQPTRLMKALHTVFEWQAQGGDATRSVSAFCLSISIRKPKPEELTPQAKDALAGVIRSNLEAAPILADSLAARCGVRDVNLLASSHWNDFVDLAIPKMIVSALLSTGWHPDPGHLPLQIARPSSNGSAITHQIVLEVLRQNGNSWSPSYLNSIKKIFSSPPDHQNVDDPGSLRISLNELYAKQDRLTAGLPRF